MGGENFSGGRGGVRNFRVVEIFSGGPLEIFSGGVGNFSGGLRFFREGQKLFRERLSVFQ